MQLLRPMPISHLDSITRAAIQRLTALKSAKADTHGGEARIQALGDDGLVDRRGQHKSEEQLSDIEILERKVKLLERQLKEKEMENELLKKVQEIERRRSSPRQRTKRNI